MTQTATVQSSVPRYVWARTAPMSVKVRPEVVAQIDQAAIAQKMSRSEWIRRTLESAIEEQHLQSSSPLPVVISD